MWKRMKREKFLSLRKEIFVEEEKVKHEKFQSLRKRKKSPQEGWSVASIFVVAIADKPIAALDTGLILDFKVKSMFSFFRWKWLVELQLTAKSLLSMRWTYQWGASLWGVRQHFSEQKVGVKITISGQQARHLWNAIFLYSSPVRHLRAHLQQSS